MKHTLISTVPEEAQPESFSGCGHGPMPAARRPLNAPPVFVNGVAIDEAAIALEAQNHSARSGAEARAAAARALVIRELLLQRAGILDLTPAPLRDAKGREETEEETLIRQVLEAEAIAQEPTEAECRRVYDSAPQRFMMPAVYEASHILIAPAEPTEQAWADAGDRAAQLVTALRDGADFAALASTHSACPSSSEGGALGRLQRGDLAAGLEEALWVLNVGAIAPAAIRTRFGWHIVRLDRRGEAQTAPYEAVCDLIFSALRERAGVAAAARYLRELAANAEIEGLVLEFGAGNEPSRHTG